MRTAVYAGSFDITTMGHIDVIQKAHALFDKLIVAVGINPAKSCWFTPKERRQLLANSVFQHISVSKKDEVFVTTFENKYLVDYCKEVGAQYYVRGIRNEADYQFEKTIVGINKELNCEAQPVWFPAALEHEHVSSSVVKGLIGPKGWEEVVSRLVPKPVYEALVQRAHAKTPQ